ncbi:MAG TPA: 1,4-dihydroxy-6-naphthoate synthase [Stackebrandtia sp.]|jgi:1,4-dihydroxy-6-naphthoate synthase|uniref:1,4-dihydroxy-6-naphthoate synthase n=1 Tax=Stackebrandtia sp. TaxID=2023065 RepID=UPI002D695985|nr:1,4-dihydroxy-6-naphthoate synthase [Stackebrandtia sp.]HZE40950.1 1,4-dihydroxy-6-naphthoate synthase [Stackebrandtia sp.]
MRLAFSPCPNDTFVFHAWVHGLVDGAPVPEVTFADVDVTNTAALNGEFDVVKVSYAALPWLLDTYELLPCGGALGRGCGPLVLARDAAASLDGATVAVPGDRTTAYLLFRLWAQGFAPREIAVVPFNEIMPGVASGRFDAGLVIHEARFTYRDHGLSMVADLGEWWESETGCPIPLGAILARRGLDTAAITRWIRASVHYAWDHPEASAAYVAEHASELSPAVTKQHIDLYVNEFSADLGDVGHAAVKTLLDRAATAGLVPVTTA